MSNPDDAQQLERKMQQRLASRRKYVAQRADQKARLNEMLLREEQRDIEAGIVSNDPTDVEFRQTTAPIVRRIHQLAKDEIAQASESNALAEAHAEVSGVEREQQLAGAKDSEWKTEGKENTEAGAYRQVEQLQMKAAGVGQSSASEAKGSYDFLYGSSMDDLKQRIAEGKEDVARPLSFHEQREIEKRMRDAKWQALQEGRKKLPVYQHKQRLMDAIAKNKVIVMVGETGSGKTTQVAQYLHEADYGKIVCTQPRRLAAISVAERVAVEMGVKCGNECGYNVRFDNKTSSRTVITYMTDGMLLKDFMREPDLKSISVIIVDEAHERSLSTDIVLGLAKDLVRFRDDLKVIISSATLEAAKFCRFFDDCPVVNIPGRTYEVTVSHTQEQVADYVEAAACRTLDIHLEADLPGDILIFLTGEEEITRCCDSITAKARALGSSIRELIVVPVFSALPAEKQRKIYDPTPELARKVVVATNIAETSITIDGIVHVIDCGLVKQNFYNPRTSMESLVVVPTSQASAKQRQGRAGRTRPGQCHRLFSKHMFENELDKETVPEILRSNLTAVVLSMVSLGISNPLDFEFIDPPAPEALVKSLEQLYALQAMDSEGKLTKTGRRMAEFPLDPKMSKALVRSEKYDCSAAIAAIVALLSSANSVFARQSDSGAGGGASSEGTRRRFFHDNSDLIALLEVFCEWEGTQYSEGWCRSNGINHRTLVTAKKARDQLINLLDRVEIPLGKSKDPTDIAKCMATGFFFNLAKLGVDANSYITVKTKQTVCVSPASFLFKEDPKPENVIFCELRKTKKEYMTSMFAVELEWLKEIAPHYFNKADLQERKKRQRGMDATPP